MWTAKYLKEAISDLKKLDPSVQKIVLAGIMRVAQNPLPQSEGGYGKPLGKKGGRNLTGFFKIKYRGIAIRVVYSLVREKQVFNIIAMSERGENHCYDLASRRRQIYKEKLFEDGF